MITIFSNTSEPQYSKIEVYGELDQVQVSSFNSIYSAWEPVVEPTIAKVNLEKGISRTNIHLGNYSFSFYWLLLIIYLTLFRAW